MTKTFETIADILEERQRTGSTPGRRSDPYKLALVLEGGAMRGVITGGFVSELERHELLGAFDLLVGSSAGACAAAYFQAGLAQQGTSIFYEDINNTKFINPLRFFSSPPTVDTSYLIDDVMVNQKPLVWGASHVEDVGKTLPELHIVTSEVGSGNTHTISNPSSVKDTLEAMRASIRIPILGGKPVEWAGHKLVDGAMGAPAPVEEAILLGSTHVLTCYTRKKQSKYSLLDRLDVAISPIVLSLFVSKAISRAYVQGYGSESRFLEATRSTLPASSRRVACETVFFPANAQELSRFEKDQDTLKAAAEKGAQAMKNFLSKKQTYSQHEKAS